MRFPRVSWAGSLAIAGLFAFLGVSGDGWQSRAAAWFDPEIAFIREPEFPYQGEYVRGDEAMQVAVMGRGWFLAVRFRGGLPGDGWVGGSPPTAQFLGRTTVSHLPAEGWRRVERRARGLGAAPPEGAHILFTEGNAAAWQHASVDATGLLLAGARTRAHFKDFQLHLEFRIPYQPGLSLGSAFRGNSGVLIFDRYEVQIVDSFGMHPGLALPPTVPCSALFGWPPTYKLLPELRVCGAIHDLAAPRLNAGLAPLAWQAYDIRFRAPRFASGRKVADARISVVQNGISIHDDVALGAPGSGDGAPPEVGEGEIELENQDYSSVRFRNIWLVAQ